MSIYCTPGNYYIKSRLSTHELLCKMFSMCICKSASSFLEFHTLRFFPSIQPIQWFFYFYISIPVFRSPGPDTIVSRNGKNIHKVSELFLIYSWQIMSVHICIKIVIVITGNNAFTYLCIAHICIKIRQIEQEDGKCFRWFSVHFSEYKSDFWHIVKWNTVYIFRIFLIRIYVLLYF